jgi:SNF2 family DNA or RNA helicase
MSVLKHGVTAAALRRATKANLKRFACVVATYAHVARLDDMDEATSKPRFNNGDALGASALHRLKWRRVICDDAHLLFNAETARFKAVSRLDAQKRWALVADAKADV